LYSTRGHRGKLSFGKDHEIGFLWARNMLGLIVHVGTYNVSKENHEEVMFVGILSEWEA